MLPHARIRPLLLLIPLAIVALVAFAACSDDNKDEDTEPTAMSDETPLDDETPVGGTIDISGVAELEDGVLTIGSDIAYAPFEYYEEGTENAAGLDVDLANALGEVLGVEVEFVNTGFDGIIPSLNTDEFDAIMSAMTITDERSQQISFVPYLSVGTGILVPSGNPDGLTGAEDLCGLTVAVQLGTIQEEQIDDLNDTCDEPIEKITFDTNPLAVEDLRTGGADANLSDYPVALLDADESDGDLEVLDVNIGPFPYGIGIRTDSTALGTALDHAMSAIIQSGRYLEILQSWGLESTALPRD